MNSSSPVATKAVRILGACSFLTVASINLTLNSLLLLVLYRGQKSFSHNAFYVITWQLVICDLTSNLIEFLVPIPLTFAGYDMYGQTIFFYIPCFVETISYNGALSFSFLMTINRITVFLFPRFNRFFFQLNLRLVIFVLWLFIFILVSAWNLVGCYKTFNTSGFYYYFVHTEDPNNILGAIISSVFGYSSTYLPIIMLFSYIAMIISIQLTLRFDLSLCKKREIGLADVNEHQRIHREFQLLAQAFLICGVFEINNLVFTSLPHIKAEGQLIFLVTFLGHLIGLSLTGINTFVLFSFNQDIRRRLKDLLLNRLGTPSAAVVSVRHSSARSHQ